jgi:hypothetical protein
MVLQARQPATDERTALDALELILVGASLILIVESQGEPSPVWPLPITNAAAKQPASLA